MKPVKEVYNQGSHDFYIEDIRYDTDDGYIVSIIWMPNTPDNYFFEIALEKLTLDYENKYKFIETISQDKETRDDFLRKLKKENVWQNIQFKKTNQYLFFKDETDSRAGLFRITNEHSIIENQAKQMLRGYWQDYCINRFKED